MSSPHTTRNNGTHNIMHYTGRHAVQCYILDIHNDIVMSILHFIRSTIIITRTIPHNILSCLVDIQTFFLRKRTLLFIHLYNIIWLFKAHIKKNKYKFIKINFSCNSPNVAYSCNDGKWYILLSNTLCFISTEKITI